MPPKFNCPDCGQPFTRKEYVERHRRLKHLGSRPFSCHDCGNSFARKDVLARHRHTCSSIPMPKNPQDPERGSGALAGPALSFTGDSQDGGRFPSVSATSNPSSSRTSNSLSFPSEIPSLSPPGESGSSTTSGNSPETPDNAYSPPDLNVWSPPRYLDPTLAPTQDEIIASEVLNDFLRSPQYSQYTPSLEMLSSSLESNHTNTSAGDPWDGATVGSAAKAEVMGIWDGGGFNSQDSLSSGIEFTPEARALADYFNQGGVGGIRALDLGFQYTPSLFPDHLFEPHEMEIGEERFFIPAQKFAQAYQRGPFLPPVKTLSHFAKVATASFLSTIPVLHPSTICMAEMPMHTALAVIVAGASYEVDGEDLCETILKAKRVHVIGGFYAPGNTEEYKFASLQSVLLYQLLGIFHSQEQQRLLSHSFHPALVTMLRDLELPRKIREASLAPPHVGLTGQELDRAWKDWVKVETWRRVAFIICLADLENATNFSTAPLLPFAELAIDLPAPDTLWNASTSTAWLQATLASASTSSPVPFLDALRALLSPSPPLPFSTNGLVLTKLSKLSSFPLLILSRALSFLQMKAEEAIRLVDPFRSMLGGVGVVDGKEGENGEILKRVERGREVLRAFPGGAKRGGGENWFESAMPSSSGAFAQRPAS